MSNSFLRNLMVNIRALFTTNLRKRDNAAEKRLNELEEKMSLVEGWIRNRDLYRNICTYFVEHIEEAKLYHTELNNLRLYGDITNFPYLNCIIAREDNIRVCHEEDVPYILHDGKRLYFKAGMDDETIRSMYSGYIYRECLLGTDNVTNKPHQYQSQRVQVEQGDVLFDIGAAEGLFALDNIDKISRIILIESDPLWIPPLKKTFSPWADKVTILNKALAVSEADNTVSLPYLLNHYSGSSMFVKMDIEGAECSTLADAKQFLIEFKENIKFSIATYHYQDDYEQLEHLLKDIDYYTESSMGYMLFWLYDTPKPPYFRHGIIRATRKASGENKQRFKNEASQKG